MRSQLSSYLLLTSAIASAPLSIRANLGFPMPRLCACCPVEPKTKESPPHAHNPTNAHVLSASRRRARVELYVRKLQRSFHDQCQRVCVCDQGTPWNLLGEVGVGGCFYKPCWCDVHNLRRGEKNRDNHVTSSGDWHLTGASVNAAVAVTILTRLQSRRWTLTSGLQFCSLLICPATECSRTTVPPFHNHT